MVCALVLNYLMESVVMVPAEVVVEAAVVAIMVVVIEEAAVVVMVAADRGLARVVALLHVVDHDRAPQMTEEATAEVVAVRRECTKARANGAISYLTYYFVPFYLV